MITEFDDIRPYHDSELPAVFEELLSDSAFMRVIAAVLPDMPAEAIAARMRACRTKEEFQRTFCYAFLRRLIAKATDGIRLDHSAVADHSQAYLYLSNHRDIVLDSAFLSLLLLEQGMNTVEIAIGDNLLIYPWIKRLVRVNKSFIVHRGLSMRQMLESSQLMSRYIHHTIHQRNQSIWMAQREGRAKDSGDHTQDSVLKMLAMGGDGHVLDRLQDLHIVPLSLSYEYDPCDYLKAQEMQLKRDNPDYHKSQADDLENMKTGIFGYKGRVTFRVRPCINEALAGMDRDMPRTELFAHISALLDHEIHAAYEIYPGNYVAYDLLTEAGAQPQSTAPTACATQAKASFADRYTPQDRARFEAYLQGQLDRISLPDRDVPFLREQILHMYANPLANHLAAGAAMLNEETTR